jgi:hypothetical protein
VCPFRRVQGNGHAAVNVKRWGGCDNGQGVPFKGVLRICNMDRSLDAGRIVVGEGVEAVDKEALVAVVGAHVADVDVVPDVVVVVVVIVELVVDIGRSHC